MAKTASVMSLTLLVSIVLCFYIHESFQTTVRLPSIPLTPNHMKAYSDRFCGPRLSTMLSLICKGKYNARKKRDIDSFGSYDNDYEGNLDGNYDYPFTKKETAISFIPRFRKRNGIVEECCQNPCSLYEMYSYCSS